MSIQCREVKAGDYSPTYQQGWIQRWENRYADLRGRYVCDVEEVWDDVIDNYELVYQFSCVSGQCSCEAGDARWDAPGKTASFAATAQESFATASRSCKFHDYITEMPPRTPAAGKLYTLAGNGKKGKLDGGLHQATLESPLAVADDGKGTIYLATSESHRLRMIVGGQVKTLNKYRGKAYSDGNVDDAGFQGVRAMISDGAGSVYVADDLRVRVIKAGIITTIAGDDTLGCKDGPALAATFSKPVGMALAGTALYIADAGCLSIRLLENGVVSTVAGNPKGKVHTGPVADVRFIAVKDVAVDAKGRVYVLGKNNVKVLEGGVISDLPLAAPDQLHEVRRLLTDQKSELVALTGSGLWKLEGGKLGPSTKLRVLLDPRGAQIDATGQLLIADRGAHKVFIYLP